MDFVIYQLNTRFDCSNSKLTENCQEYFKHLTILVSSAVISYLITIVCLTHYSTACLATPDHWLKTSVVSATYCLCAIICLDLIKRYRHYLSHNQNTRGKPLKIKILH